MRFRYHTLAFIVCVTASTALFAADTGNIQVEAVSEDGRPLSGVAVVARSRGGEVYQTDSDDLGRAVLRGLGAGLYRIEAARPGYVDVIEPSVRVVRDKTVPFRLRMREVEGRVENIVVTAKAVGGDRYGAVSNLRVSREELRTAVGSGSDVLRALDGLPGLASSGGFSSFTVRGRGPRDNLILVDDIPFDKIVHFDEALGETEDVTGGGRFSIFPPNLIEGAEFSPGGWGAAYGGRNGSLLKLDVARGNPSPAASFRIDFAGFEFIYDGPSGFDDDTSVIFTAREFDFGRLFELIGELDFGEPVMTDVILKTHTWLNENNELEFLALYTPETDFRGVKHVLAGEEENFEDRELIDTEQDSTLFGLTWRRLIGDDGQWENRLYIRDSDKTSSQGEAFHNSIPMKLPVALVPVLENVITIEEVEKETGWRSDLTLGNRWGRFSAGLRAADLDIGFATTLTADWRRYEYESGDLQPGSSRKYIVITPESANSSFMRGELQYAAYLEQVFEAGAWDIRTGLRYDYDGFSDAGYVSPRLVANYRLSPTTRIAATAGVFHQSPRFLDRAADPENFGLGNERTDHVSIGFNHQFGRNWDILIEGYSQRLDELVTEPDAVTGRATNNGEGTSYGLDLVANRRFEDGWSANIAYSFNEATLNDNDGEGDYDAPFNHEHLLSVGMKWEINERWMTSFRYKYATGRPRDEYDLHEDVLADEGGPPRFSREFTTKGTLRWGNSQVLNVRVDYRRPIGPVDFIAFLDIINFYSASSSSPREFNPVTGDFISDEEEAIPLLGLRFEKTW